MSGSGINDFLVQARQELAEYDQNAQRFTELLQSNQRKRGDLQQRRNAARAALAMSVLPNFAPETLLAAAEKLGLPGIRRAQEQLVDRDAAIEKRLQAIQSDPYYLEKDLRRLRIETKQREIVPLLSDAKNALAQLNQLEGMTGLLQRGYDTDQYPHRGFLRFLNAEYLRDWKNSDRICAALGVSKFSEAARKYHDRTEQVEVLGKSVQIQNEELEQITGLETEQRVLLAEREQLPELTKARVGDELYRLIQARGTDDPLVQKAMATVDGVEHQVRYLEQTHTKIETDYSQLLERSGKLREEAQRYQSDPYKYRNKTFSRDQLSKRFGRATRYSSRVDRYDRVTNTVYVFDDYDRGIGLSDVLWWDLMTDGRIDGNFIPEVAEYREANPNYAFERDTSYDRSSSDNARDDS
jgi:hypothetical protein